MSRSPLAHQPLSRALQPISHTRSRPLWVPTADGTAQHDTPPPPPPHAHSPPSVRAPTAHAVRDDLRLVTLLLRGRRLTIAALHAIAQRVRQRPAAHSRPAGPLARCIYAARRCTGQTPRPTHSQPPLALLKHYQLVKGMVRDYTPAWHLVSTQGKELPREAPALAPVVPMVNGESEATAAVNPERLAGVVVRKQFPGREWYGVVSVPPGESMPYRYRITYADGDDGEKMQLSEVADQQVHEWQTVPRGQRRRIRLLGGGVPAAAPTTTAQQQQGNATTPAASPPPAHLPTSQRYAVLERLTEQEAEVGRGRPEDEPCQPQQRRPRAPSDPELQAIRRLAAHAPGPSDEAGTRVAALNLDGLTDVKGMVLSSQLRTLVVDILGICETKERAGCQRFLGTSPRDDGEGGGGRGRLCHLHRHAGCSQADALSGDPPP